MRSTVGDGETYCSNTNIHQEMLVQSYGMNDDVDRYDLDLEADDNAEE